MRKVIYSEYVAKVEYNDGSVEKAPKNDLASPNQSGPKRRFNDLEEQGEALLHGWGMNYEEFEGGPGNFTSAIIELEGGTVKNVPAEHVRFISGEVGKEDATRELEISRKQVHKLNEAIEWALGYDTPHDVLFEPPTNSEPRYWWRRYLGQLRNEALKGEL